MRVSGDQQKSEIWWWVSGWLYLALLPHLLPAVTQPTCPAPPQLLLHDLWVLLSGGLSMSSGSAAPSRARLLGWCSPV